MLYERLVAHFPTSGRYWRLYIEQEVNLAWILFPMHAISLSGPHVYIVTRRRGLHADLHTVVMLGTAWRGHISDFHKSSHLICKRNVIKSTRQCHLSMQVKGSIKHKSCMFNQVLCMCMYVETVRLHGMTVWLKTTTNVHGKFVLQPATWNFILFSSPNINIDETP